MDTYYLNRIATFVERASGIAIDGLENANVEGYLKRIMDAAEFMPYMIAQGAGSAVLTGTTNETDLATFTIPGGAMGAHGQLVVEALWQLNAPANANAKTYRLRFGNFVAVGTSFASQLSYLHRGVVVNTAAATQAAPAALTGSGPSTTAPLTGAVNTAADVLVRLTGQLAVGTDSMTLLGYRAMIYPKA